jgi:hypothetical protein
MRRRLLLLTLVTSGMMFGSLVGSAAAASYGPYPTYESCQRAAGNYSFHGYYTRECQPAYPGVQSWYFQAWIA